MLLQCKYHLTIPTINSIAIFDYTLIRNQNIIQ